jgi:hypothetical protein
MPPIFEIRLRLAGTAAGFIFHGSRIFQLYQESGPAGIEIKPPRRQGRKESFNIGHLTFNL